VAPLILQRALVWANYSMGIQQTSFLDLFRGKIAERVLGLGCSLAAFGCTTSCSPHRGVNPNDRSFSATSNSELTVSTKQLVAISSDTLVVSGPCTGLELEANVAGYTAADTNQSFAIWVVPLIPDPNDRSRKIVDINNAQAFGAKPLNGCAAIIPDPPGVNGDRLQRAGSLPGGGGLEPGQYFVLLTHGNAHWQECPGKGLDSHQEPSEVHITGVKISGRRPLGAPVEGPAFYFASSRNGSPGSPRRF
jgi:hypothetical protein